MSGLTLSEDLGRPPTIQGHVVPRPVYDAVRDFAREITCTVRLMRRQVEELTAERDDLAKRLDAVRQERDEMARQLAHLRAALDVERTAPCTGCETAYDTCELGPGIKCCPDCAHVVPAKRLAEARADRDRIAERLDLLTAPPVGDMYPDGDEGLPLHRQIDRQWSRRYHADVTAWERERADARAILDGAGVEVQRLRALLAEALDGWRAADGSGGVRTTGQDDRRITEIRREAGL